MRDRSGWDYRVMYFPKFETYEVVEIFFNKKGKPDSYCKTKSLGTTLFECRRDVIAKEEATYKPVLMIKNNKLVEMK